MSKIIRVLIFTFVISFISIDSSQNISSGVFATGPFIVENARLKNSMVSQAEFAGFDKTVNSFMKKWELTGVSVAVAKDGKLLYTKGFGFADKEKLIPTEPYHKFRVASVSKLVTAIAIMKLQENGQLKVTDKVFGPEGILNDELYNNPVDKRVYGITLAHLLSHEGGWSARWGDQMFMPVQVAKALDKPLPVSTQDIVRFALNKRLHFTPGK